MMEKLLSIKHWQLFGLLIGVGIIDSILDLSTSQLAFYFPALLFAAIYFGWLWAMAINLYPKLPTSTNYNLKRFKLYLIIPLVYISALSVLIGNISIWAQDENNSGYVAILIPMHLFSMYCIFWCLAYVAKSLKSVELQKSVTFSDYAGEFFLIWFFPIGIWFIQPRLNKMFDSTGQAS